MIKTTTNYDMFSLMEQNRDVNLNDRKVKNLANSMIEYGWLDAFPLMARMEKGKLIVIEGQHRLAVAREYGIPAKYVIEDQEIDVARINDTSHPWTIPDYAKKHAKAGNRDYEELLEFSNRYGISISMSAGVMANTASPGNILHQLKAGTWAVKNRTQAYALASCYQELCGVSNVFKKINAIKVLWACFQISYFDPNRLISGAFKRSAEIKPITKLELFYELFEDIYNHGKKEKHPLKFDAEQALKNRNPIKGK